jgi:hypothetical protein
MKFYYENLDFKNVSNGYPFCHISNLDWNYGFSNPIFELNDVEPIIWNFSIIGEMNSQVVDANKDYLESVFDKVKDKPNIKIVFSNFHEGTNQNPFFSRLILFKDKFNLATNQIVVVTNNKHSELFNKHGIKVIHKPYLFGFLVDHYRDIKHTSIDYKGTEIGLLNVNQYLESEKKKFFLTYNKNTTKTFRIQLILWLIKNGLIDDSYVSILIKNNNFNKRELDSNEIELNGLAEYYDEFDKIGFNVLDWDYPNHKNDVFSNLKYTTKSHYADTYFNIITETSFENNSLNLTEKSFKAFANCHPFLIIGDMDTHKYLQSLGFELYDDLIDYSFDSMPDNQKRLNDALGQIRKVHKLGINSIINFYKNNIEKIKKNKERFFEYSFSKMIDDTIKELHI